MGHHHQRFPNLAFSQKSSWETAVNPPIRGAGRAHECGAAGSVIESDDILRIMRAISCYLCSRPATEVSDPSGGGYWVVRSCEKCIRYRIGEGVAKLIEKAPPPLGIRTILLDLSEAARRIAEAEEPPAVLHKYAVPYGGGGWIPQITDDQNASEIAASMKLV